MHEMIFVCVCMCVTIMLSSQSCPTLCDLKDCGPLGSSVQGNFQARILEWVAIFFSPGSSGPRDQTRVSPVSCTGRQIFFFFLFLTTVPSGKPQEMIRDRIWVLFLYIMYIDNLMLTASLISSI